MQTPLQALCPSCERGDSASVDSSRNEGLMSVMSTHAFEHDRSRIEPPKRLVPQPKARKR